VILALLGNIMQTKGTPSIYVNKVLPVLRHNAMKIKKWGVEPEVVHFISMWKDNDFTKEEARGALSKFDVSFERPIQLRMRRTPSVIWSKPEPQQPQPQPQLQPQVQQPRPQSKPLPQTPWPLQPKPLSSTPTAQNLVAPQADSLSESGDFSLPAQFEDEAELRQLLNR
jgi:hypothetical protein